MDSDQEIRLARRAYNWLRISPLLTIPTLLILYQLSSPAACAANNQWCGNEFAAGGLVGILGSALWHLVLLQYANNKDSEFVRKHGRQALQYAGIRTAVPLVFLTIDFFTGSQGLLTCLAIPILVALWLINSKTGFEQIKKEKGEPAAQNQPASARTSGEQGNETLSNILDGLQSADQSARLSALQELEKLNYGSEAVLLRLEKMAIHDADAAVRKSALDLLAAPVYRQIQNQLSSVARNIRQIILQEINSWEKDGLLPSANASVIRQRYDFTARPIHAQKLAATPAPPPVVALAQEKIPAAPAARVEPSVPSKPQLTLTERLLSQASINIFLYLGAFLVIGAALILAALVAATRLPILLGVTALFASGAIVIKKRLPQPSFTLFIVFSFLLPIDASVLSQSLNLSEQAASGYWAMIFFGMAIVWGFAVWFYSSRLFSIAAFVSVSLASVNFGAIFNAPTNWNIFSIALANMVGLLGVYFLKNWKDGKFALPLFISAQIIQALAVLVSLTAITLDLFADTATTNGWIASALIWTMSASFYAWSGLLFPFILFPWAAAASLLPVSWLALKTFDASAPTQIIGTWVWGALFALLSEFLARKKAEYLQKFSLPFLTASAPLFIVAGSWGLIENTAYGFASLAGAAIVYTILMILRPRAYVWVAALLAGLAGFFAFFNLSFVEKANILPVYQLLGAALLLLVPELFFRSPFKFNQPWRWPPFIIGLFVAFVNLSAALLSFENFGASAIVFGVYALLSAAYALHFKRAWIGYFAAAFFAIGIQFALQQFDLDIWLPVFTGLSVLYFAAGYFLRAEKTRGWGSMLRFSGLTLGAIISLAAVFALKETGGWYALVIGALFIVETYLRREDRMEAGGPILFSIAAFLILRDFKVYDVSFHLLSISLIWLTTDLIFSRTLKPRRASGLTRAVGVAFTIVNGILLLIPDFASAGQAAISYGIYAAFFAYYAWFYRRPKLGYIPTTSAALSIFYTLRYFDRDLWLPVFTGLAVLYFALGYFLRTEKTRGWGSMLRISGLILGALLSLTALVTVKTTGGWYVLVIGALAVSEVFIRPEDRLEAGGPILFSIASFLILNDLRINDFPYQLLAVSLIWLGADLIYARALKTRRLAIITRVIGGGIAGLNAITLLAFATPEQAAISFGVYAVFFAVYAWLYRKPLIGYAATVSLPLSIFFALRSLQQDNWLYAIVAVAVLYYVAGIIVRRREDAQDWSRVLLYSGLWLGTINSLSAPLQVGLDAAIPVAIAATLFASEAFARRNVRLGFPANLLYLEAYFLILIWLKVDEPQYFSMGAAILGMLMHYLLTRAGGRTGAFLTGMFSQLVLLGTTYIQLYSTEKLGFFVVIFFQALAVLIYGIVIRSRSLVIAPIIFIVLSVFTVIYGVLKGISTVILIGCTGILLLSLGILAVILRERLTKIGERFSDWQA
ncbi:MAG: hypothetical protein HYX49_06170 [Chloroflexi bacterium]|nr:hypothetical protein [Chloroflexota bacterium]